MTKNIGNKPQIALNLKPGKKKLMELQRKFLSEKNSSPVNSTYILKHKKPGDTTKPIPLYVSLVNSGNLQGGYDQLFVDFVPIPANAWSYNAKDKMLIWNDQRGGGQLFFTHAGYGGGYGMINPGLFGIAVSASATANFSCAVAENTGATCIVDNEQVTGFNWDISSQPWTSANWEQNRLLLSYSYTPGTPWQPGTVSFSFTDNQTSGQNIPWTPESNFEANLNLGQLKNGQFGWVLDFKSSINPPTDNGASNPDTVYPCWLQANEDMAAQVINGVMAIDNLDPLKGMLIGLQGAQSNPGLMGYYQIENAAAPFGIFLDD